MKSAMVAMIEASGALTIILRHRHVGAAKRASGADLSQKLSMPAFSPQPLGGIPTHRDAAARACEAWVDEDPDIHVPDSEGAARTCAARIRALTEGKQ